VDGPSPRRAGTVPANGLQTVDVPLRSFANRHAVVTLAGSANASDKIARAVALAKAVPGVKSVINILAVVKDS